jgi:hypothetical protein
MRIAALAALAFLPALASASTYDCAVKNLGSQKPLWAAKVVLNDKAADAKIFIVKLDGTSFLLADLIKGLPDDGAIRAVLQDYEGMTVVGLRKQKQSLDLNLGHVDTSNKKDAAPIDADAWASPEARMIGVTDVRAGLSATCRKE